MLMTRFELAAPENEHFALFVHDMESKEQGSGRQLKTTWGRAGLEGGGRDTVRRPSPVLTTSCAQLQQAGLDSHKKTQKVTFALQADTGRWLRSRKVAAPGRKKSSSPPRAWSTSSSDRYRCSLHFRDRTAVMAVVR